MFWTERGRQRAVRGERSVGTSGSSMCVCLQWTHWKRLWRLQQTWSQTLNETEVKTPFLSRAGVSTQSGSISLYQVKAGSCTKQVKHSPPTTLLVWVTWNAVLSQHSLPFHCRPAQENGNPRPLPSWAVQSHFLFPFVGSSLWSVLRGGESIHYWCFHIWAFWPFLKHLSNRSEVQTSSFFFFLNFAS